MRHWIVGFGLCVVINTVIPGYSSAVAATTATLKGYAGKCLTLPGGTNRDGQPLTLHDCDGRPGQAFTMHLDAAQIMAQGKCVGVRSASKETGARIDIGLCTGAPHQRWQHTEAGELINEHSQLCMHVREDGTADGTPIIQYSCYGDQSQRWTVDSTAASQTIDIEPDVHQVGSLAAAPIEFTVTVKSYIAPIGNNRGFIFGRLRDAALGITVELAALAAVTDRQFSENPQNNRQDKGYRLYTRLSGSASCTNDGDLVGLTRRITSDSGKEGPLQAPPLDVDSRFRLTADRKTWNFSWVASGRPNAVAEPAFQLVWPRTKRHIWHKIQGNVRCNDRGGLTITATRFEGSKFPSHRYWLLGNEKTTINQGPFAGLWRLSDPPAP